MVENLTNCRYDGDVVKEFEKANATHVVCNSKVRKYLSLRFIDFYCLQTAVEIDHIRILSIGLELACNGG